MSAALKPAPWYKPRVRLTLDGATWTLSGPAAYREDATDGLPDLGVDPGGFARYLAEAATKPNATVTERVRGHAIIDGRYVFAEHLLGRVEATWRVVDERVDHGTDVATLVGLADGQAVAIVMGMRRTPSQAQNPGPTGAHAYPKCPTCEGSGGAEECSSCEGAGKKECIHCGHESECEDCGGRGVVGRCKACKGSKVWRPEAIADAAGGSGTR